MSSEQERQIAQISGNLLEAMIADLATTIAISGHREVKLCRTPCHRCGQLCRGKLQVPTATAGASTILAPPPYSSHGNKSRSSTPQLGGEPSGSQSKNGNILLPCLYCGRPIASNRFAPHLAGCLGLNGGSRRTARTAAAGNGKSRMGSERSASSVYLDNDSDAGSDASGPTSYSTTASSTIPKTNRGPGRPPKNVNGKRSNSPAVKLGNAKKVKVTSVHPHPLTQSATFADSPMSNGYASHMGAKGFPQHYIGSKLTRGPEADGDEDAEGEDDVEFDDASGAGYLDADAEGEEDDEHDEYLQSGDGSDASEGGDEGQEIDDEYA